MSTPARQNAFVVFTGQTDLPWLKILKPGFRHCFVMLYDGRRWASLDPMANRMELIIHDQLPPGFNVPRWLEEQGHKVVPAQIDGNCNKPAPFMLFTCVEVVKRVLGVHSFWIMTPWQLYKQLCRREHLKTANHLPKTNKGDLSWEA